MNLAITFIIAALACFSGWEINGWRLGMEIQSIKAKHSDEMVQQANEASAKKAVLEKVRDALADKLAALNADYTTKLSKARHDNQTLRDRLASGTIGLRIDATCPSTPAGSAQAAQGGSVDSGSGAQLSAAAGSAYSALRDNITTTETTLIACQNSLRLFQ
jgi:phage-related tail protein